MTNKREEGKRLLIYLALVFITASTPIFLWKPMKQSIAFSFIVGITWCCFPAIANLITRRATNEGWRDMKLHLRLKGNFIWYLIAFFIPVVAVSFSVVLSGLVNHERILADNVGMSDLLGVLLMVFSQVVMFSFVGVGEELGWRAYMNQKLELLFGNRIACLLGGIIWALWHIPNDIAGGLAGEVSWHEVFVGSFERSVLLICFGVLLMYLTNKTDSVWPAVVGHITYNASIAMSGQAFGEANAFATSREIHWIMFIPFVVIGIISFILISHFMIWETDKECR